MLELQLRGAVLGWLLRVFGGRTREAVVIAVALSVLSGLSQIAAPQASLLLFGEAVIAAVFLCEFARRWCFEAAIASSVAMEIAGAIVVLALGSA